MENGARVTFHPALFLSSSIMAAPSYHFGLSSPFSITSASEQVNVWMFSPSGDQSRMATGKSRSLSSLMNARENWATQWTIHGLGRKSYPTCP